MGSEAPGEQLLTPVTSTNTGPRQQGPAPAPQPPTPPVTVLTQAKVTLFPPDGKMTATTATVSEKVREQPASLSVLFSQYLSVSIS